ncbi:MAG: methyltransferase domain-containing protein [Bradymonadales bacterium]|nr:methyltransferase domain-containing protein [Bradymonadales bacterium]
MDTDLTLAPYAAQGDWHLVLPRYILCSRWTRDKRVLDLVCGRGIGCEILRRSGATRIVGVDTREEVVQWAADHLSSHTVSFRSLHKGSALPFDDRSFDAIVALNPTRGFGQAHFQEIRRVLAPDGLLVVAEPLGPYVTLAQFLPFFDRDPIGEPSDPADIRLLIELFGEPFVVNEHPILGLLYRPWSGADLDYGYERPDLTLTRGLPSSRMIHQRLLAFGLSPDQTCGQLIPLPYYETAGQIEQMIREAHQELEMLQANKAVLEEELRDQDREIQQLEDQANLLQREIEVLQNDLQQAEDQQALLEEPPSSLMAFPTDLTLDWQEEAQVQEIWEAATRWQEYAESLRAEFDRFTAEQRERELEAQRQLAQLEEALTFLKEEHASCSGELATSQEALARSKEEILRRDQRIETLENDLVERERRLDQFTQEVSTTIEESQQVKRDLAAAESRLAEVRTSQTKVQETSIGLDKEIRSKNAQIQTLERERMAMRVEMAALERENEKLSIAKAALDRQLATQPEELSSANRTIEELRQLVERHEAQIAAFSIPPGPAGPPLERKPGELAITDQTTPPLPEIRVPSDRKTDATSEAFLAPGRSEAIRAILDLEEKQRLKAEIKARDQRILTLESTLARTEPASPIDDSGAVTPSPEQPKPPTRPTDIRRLTPPPALKGTPPRVTPPTKPPQAETIPAAIPTPPADQPAEAHETRRPVSAGQPGVEPPAEIQPPSVGPSLVERAELPAESREDLAESDWIAATPMVAESVADEKPAKVLPPSPDREPKMPPPTAEPEAQVTPLAEPVAPAGEPIIPAAEPVEPAGEPIIPAAEPVEPAGEPIIPAAEPVAPAVEPAPQDSESPTRQGEPPPQE